MSNLQVSTPQPRLKPWKADIGRGSDEKHSNTKVDIEKALKLPHLVKTGQFNFRTNVIGRSATIKKRVIKSAAVVKEDSLSQFQRFLLDHKQVRRNKEEIQERTLLTQHKDVWIGNLKKLQNGSGGLNSEIELLLATLFKDISNSDSAKVILEEMLEQINRSIEYHQNLRQTVGKLHFASRKTAQTGRKRVVNKVEYQNARKKIESLRKLILDGLDSLEAEYDNIEDELAKIKISPDTSDVETGEEDAVKLGGNIFEKTTSPVSSPDLVSSDSGFKTDEGTRSSVDENGTSQSEILDPDINDLDEDDTTSEATLKNEEENEGSVKKSYERFDIAFSDNGECIMKDCEMAGFPHLEYEHYLCDDGEEEDDDDRGSDDNQALPPGTTKVMIELEKYFQQPRRWDIFDIDEVDESNASPVTNSPIAICTRVTPLEYLKTRNVMDNDDENDIDNDYSTAEDTDTASITGTIVMEEADVENKSAITMEDLKNLDLNIKSFSLPKLKPVSELLSTNDCDNYSLEGSDKFTTAFDALETHYKTKVVIVTEKLKKHEEDRPEFLTKELKNRLMLIKAVYPSDHPNYTMLWVDMFCRILHQKVSPNQVKLADLWLRERMHLENQLMACKTDMERELVRTEKRIKKVVSWMADKSRAKEVKRDEMEGQRLVCARLHDELSMMREYKRLRMEEKERKMMIINAKKENIRLEQLKEEQMRREVERDKILQWKRNKIDVQNLSRLQLEDELRIVLRQRQQKKFENNVRVRFRKVQFDKKVDEREEKKRLVLRSNHEKNVRLECLRRSARRRLGVHVIPSDRSRLTKMTKAAESRLLTSSALAPLYSINSWSQDDLSRDQRLVLEQELRDRGLLDNEYAIQQILNLEPPTLHRPDAKSTITLGTRNNPVISK